MKLCIDPGHGLGNRKKGVYDPGTIAGGQAEASIALEWALTLKHLASEAGIECWLTRTSRDYAAPLSARVARAKANSCTRILSVHCNDSGTGTVRGTETFYRSGSKSGAAWALAVQEAAITGFRSLDVSWESRGIKPDTESQHKGGLAILKGNLPSALLELGWQDNDDDRALLVSKKARVAVCERLVLALVAAMPKTTTSERTDL